MRFLPLALILAASAANAGALQDTMFPHNAACYLRYYNSEHLAAHPAQQVETLQIGPDYEHFGETPLPLRVVVYLRGNSQQYRAIAYCEDADKALLCQMEGDAGAFKLEPGRDGALRLSVAPDGMSFEGETNFVTLNGQTQDDGVFLLPPVPADACP